MNISKTMVIKDRNTLYERFGKENEEEQEKERELALKLLDFYHKVYGEEKQILSHSIFDYNFYTFGYKKEHGYFVVEYDGSKSYMVTTHGDDVERAFFNVACRMIDKKRAEYYVKNRRDINKEFKKRFKEIKYPDSIFRYEYDLSIWNKYYDGVLPEELISNYEEYVNSNYELMNIRTKLKYDVESHKFVYIDNPKVRSLKK